MYTHAHNVLFKQGHHLSEAKVLMEKMDKNEVRLRATQIACWSHVVVSSLQHGKDWRSTI